MIPPIYILATLAFNCALDVFLGWVRTHTRNSWVQGWNG